MLAFNGYSKVSAYELAILGDVPDSVRTTLSNTIGRMVSEFGLTIGREIVIHDGVSVERRNKHSACAAVYFGSPEHHDIEAAQEIIRSGVPVIPTISRTGNFSAHLPAFMQASNGLRLRQNDPELIELAAALLECVGLLRRQRRIFVSYRRVESSSAAIQLHDLMTARGFDVFLDTHDIRPGDPFQEVLWHRLCDADVMVMLDTPTYFESKWTRQEIGRARAKEIHVLRVVWPSHTSSKLTDMAETVYLDVADLSGADGPIADKTAEQIVLAVENLRSRSIASRYMSMTGRLRAEIEKIGAKVECVGAHRAILVRLLDDRKLWAYPVVGIPTAELLNDIAEKAKCADQSETPIMVYDHIGIREQWIAHLKWLDENIRAVRAVKISEAGWALAAWED